MKTKSTMIGKIKKKKKKKKIKKIIMKQSELYLKKQIKYYLNQVINIFI